MKKIDPPVPVREYDWTDDYSFLRALTCKNHPTALYYTKNPWYRSLGVIKLPEGDIERSETGECNCPLGDLVVIGTDKPEKENAMKAKKYAGEIAAMFTRMLVADGEEVIITAEGDGTLVVNCEGVAATVYYDAYDNEWKAVV